MLSSRPIDFTWIKNGMVEQMSDVPTGIVAKLEERGYRHAYFDGGVTIQRFLAAGLIDRMRTLLVQPSAPIASWLSRRIRDGVTT